MINSEIGKKVIQYRLINLSYRYRGKILRTTTRKKRMKRKDNHSNPLKNRILVRLLKNRMEPYSLKKRKTNPKLLYSVLNPEINSDSASLKSKGVRLVSARTPINQGIKSNIFNKLVTPSRIKLLSKESRANK